MQVCQHDKVINGKAATTAAIGALLSEAKKPPRCLDGCWQGMKDVRPRTGFFVGVGSGRIVSLRAYEFVLLSPLVFALRGSFLAALGSLEG